MSLEYSTEMESGDNRCAKCSLVILRELTRVMQDLLEHAPIPATHLYNTIQDDDYFKRNHLNDDQIKMVESLNTHGYGIVDISLAYKLIANYYSIYIPRPSQGWGKEPTSTQTKIGDDIERIRILRNQFVHLVNTNLSVESFNKFFTECIKIGRRVDGYLSKPANDSYESKIKGYHDNSLDSVLARKHLDAMAEIEKLKKKVQCEIGKLTVHVFIGRTIDQACAMITQTGVAGKIDILITFHGIDDSEHTISVINSMKETFTTKNIRVKTVVRGCINVFIEVEKKVIVDEVMFESEICIFIQKLCNICKLTCIAQETANAVITTTEGDFECESEINTLEAYSEADQAQEKFTTTLENLFKELAGKGNKENMIGNDDMENAFDPLATERSGLHSQNEVQADKLSASRGDQKSIGHVFDYDFHSKSRISTSKANSEIDQTSEKFSKTLEGFFNDLAGNRNDNNIVGKDDMDEALVNLATDDFHSKSRISTSEANSEIDQTSEKLSTTLEGFFNDLAGNRNDNNIVGKDDMDEALVNLATVDVENGSQSSTLETNSEVNEAQEKIGTTLEGFIKDFAGKGNENNMVGKDDIDNELVHLASTVCTKGNMSNVVGERNQIGKISTELTTMKSLLIDEAAKGMEMTKENNDIIDALIHRGTDAICRFEKMTATLEGLLKDQPAKGIEKNETKDTSFDIPYATGLKRKFDE